LIYGLALGIGTLIGGLSGTSFAYNVETALLQRLFGFLLIFPLVTMMRLGEFWLDPTSSDFFLITTGNAIIWLAIGIPIWLLSTRYLIPRRWRERESSSMTASPSTE
jgi:uncharacterized membrane protein YfcA